MEKRHPVAEARAETAERLRRQRDLRHEDDRAATGGEGGFAGADVDLGLAATRGAREEGVAAAAREQDFDPSQRVFLRLGETSRRGLGGQGRRRGHLAPLAAPRALLRRDQR